MKIFVGNLSGGITKTDLRQAFESFGQVRSVTIVVEAGKTRGFGFVTMPVAKEARNAIESMNGKDLGGQTIKVEKVRTKTKARANRRKRSSSGKGGRAPGGRKRNSGGRRAKRRR